MNIMPSGYFSLIVVIDMDRVTSQTGFRKLVVTSV